MRNVLTIAANDIFMFLKDRMGYVWLFAMPLVFIYFFGVAMKPSSSSPANPRPSVLIENQDRGYLGRLLMQEMDAQGMRLVEPTEDDSPNRGIRIPADFTERVEQQDPVEITFFRVEESPLEADAMIEARLLRAIIGMTSGLFAVATEGVGQLTEEVLVARLKRGDKVQLDVRFAGRRPVPMGFEQSVPGYMVMFIMMNLLMYGGVSIAGERRTGVISRIAVHPIKKWQLVAGKILGLFLLGMVQLGVFLLAGRLMFGVSYEGNLPLIILTLAVFAWLCASLGVLVGATVQSPERVEGLCLLASLLMAALGGCWWPMEIVPDFMKQVGHAFPTAWAMDALHQLISFGGGFAEVQGELLILALFALVTTALATRFLRCA